DDGVKWPDLIEPPGQRPAIPVKLVPGNRKGFLRRRSGFVAPGHERAPEQAVTFVLPYCKVRNRSPAWSLPRDARQHLLHRGHRGVELFRIARADDEVGVRLLVLVLERIAADDGVGMRIGDLAQRPADVT